MEISNTVSTIKKTDEEEQIANQNNNINETENHIPIYMDLYPPVIDNLDFDSQQKVLKQNTKTNFKSKRKITDEEFREEVKEDIYEMDNDFLDSLLQRKTNLDKNKIINTITYFIRNSKLIQKLESEFRSEKKSELDLLVRTCAKNLNYIKLKKGQVLFKIGDAGDRFYFILSGKVNILKLKELKDINLTYVEYLQYCIFLIESKEDYILNEVTKKNRKLLDISYPEDIIKLYRIVFLKILREHILNHFIQNNRQLAEFFNSYKQKMEDFHLVQNELIHLEEQKLKAVYGSTKEWEAYILKRCRPGIKDVIFFEDYEQKFKDKSKKNVICYIYESFLFLGPGLFFGDFALDSEHNKRNATIRAEEETILGWLKSVDYANMIAPKRKIEKYNEIMFLFKNFFFNHINSHTFERKYFHLFPPQEFYKDMVIFKSGNLPESLYFIKEGQISLEFKCSIFEIHFLIRQIFETLIRNEYYKRIISRSKNEYYLIGEDEMKKIRKYFTEPIFFKLRDKSERFREELERKIKHKLTVLGGNELIGLEEIFLGFPYLCTGKVVSKKLICYELSVKQLNNFIEFEKNIVTPYTKASVNKIITLMDRLQNIKKNGIYMARLKYDNNKEKNNEQNISSNNSITISRDQIDKSINNNSRVININSFIRKINSYNDKRGNKDNNKNSENPNSSIIKNKHLYNILSLSNKNKKNMHKNFSFMMTPYAEIKKNKNNYIQYSFNKLKHNNSDILLIGNTCIKINNVRKEINKYNIFDNNNNNPINNANYSRIFELSQCRYPLSEEREKNIESHNINNNNNFQNIEIRKILNNHLRSLSDSKNNSKEFSNNKNYMSEERDTFYKRIKANIQLLNNKLKKQNNDSPNLTKTTFKNKINIIDISQVTQDETNANRFKIIHPKELLPDIIKEYYNELKSKGCLSFISKKDKNTFFTRKFNEKYNKEKNNETKNSKLENDNTTNLPKIILNSPSQDKNAQVMKSLIKK